MITGTSTPTAKTPWQAVSRWTKLLVLASTCWTFTDMALGFRDDSNVVRIANVFAERKAGWGDQGAGMLMLPSP
jgi:hypothetical protein